MALEANLLAKITLTDSHLHVGDKSLFDPPAVIGDFIQVLQLIVIASAHFDRCRNVRFFTV